MRTSNSRPWKTKPFFALDDLPVIKKLKKNWRALSREYDRYRSTPDRDEYSYPLPFFVGEWRQGVFRTNEIEFSYIPFSFQRKTVIENFLVEAGETNEATIRRAYIEMFLEAIRRNRTRCPLLTSILDPLYPDCCAAYAYSLMRPGVVLPQHSGRDVGNVRVHFCLQEADNCSLTVLNEQRTWKAGEAWAFDDAVPHSAEHHGSRDRVIVIMDLTKNYVEIELTI